MFARSPRYITGSLRSVPSYLRPIRRPQSGQQLRFSSAQVSNEAKPEGSLNHKTFYKTFGRPIAKVFLMAIFTYQVAYYFWVRLEQDEIRGEMEATISELEARIDKLEQARSQKEKG